MNRYISGDAELAQAIAEAQPGDTISLAPGAYGGIEIHGGQWNKVRVGSVLLSGAAPSDSGGVTIQSAVLTDRAQVQSIDVRESARWKFHALDVRPGWQPETTRAVNLAGDGCAIVNCDISHGDPTGWTPQNWLDRAGHGVEVRGRNCDVLHNRITTVATGVQFIGDAGGGVARGNHIEGVHRDAIRARSDDLLIEDNRCYKWRLGDPGNHDDGIQSWNETLRHGGTVRNAVIRRNLFWAPPELSEHGYLSPMGLTVTHTHAVGWLVEHNVFALDMASGIQFYSAKACTVQNNTVIDINPDGGASRATIWGHYDSMCVIKNNLANQFNWTGSPHETGNVALHEDTSEYDDWFADWRAGDFTLKNPSGPGATLMPRNQPLPSGPVPVQASPVIPATKEYWQVVETKWGAVAERVITGVDAPLTEVEARALEDQINGAR